MVKTPVIQQLEEKIESFFVRHEFMRSSSLDVTKKEIVPGGPTVSDMLDYLIRRGFSPLDLELTPKGFKDTNNFIDGRLKYCETFMEKVSRAALREYFKRAVDKGKPAVDKKGQYYFCLGEDIFDLLVQPQIKRQPPEYLITTLAIDSFERSKEEGYVSPEGNRITDLKLSKLYYMLGNTYRKRQKKPAKARECFLRCLGYLEGTRSYKNTALYCKKLLTLVRLLKVNENCRVGIDEQIGIIAEYQKTARLLKEEADNGLIKKSWQVVSSLEKSLGVLNRFREKKDLSYDFWLQMALNYGNSILNTFQYLDNPNEEQKSLNMHTS